MPTLRIQGDKPARTYDLGPLGKQRLKPGDALSVPAEHVGAVTAALGPLVGLVFRWVGRAVVRAVREAVDGKAPHGGPRRSHHGKRRAAAAPEPAPEPEPAPLDSGE